MDLKCKNCGQFLEENDLFCRYCGCPNTVAEEKTKPKLNQKQLADQAQEQKTIVSTEEVGQACEIDYSLVKVERKGELFSLRLQSIIVAVIAFLFSGGGLAMAIVLKGVDGNVLLRFLGIFVGIIIIFIGLVVAIERINLVTTYSNMKEKTITVPKYGLRKTPMFMLGGYIFTIDCECVCPACQGESQEQKLKDADGAQATNQHDNTLNIDPNMQNTAENVDILSGGMANTTASHKQGYDVDTQQGNSQKPENATTDDIDNTTVSNARAGVDSQQLQSEQANIDDDASTTAGVDTSSHLKTKKKGRRNNDTRVLGDLHVELIDKRAVAVCNYNRKHIYSLSSAQFFDYYLGKTKEMLEQAKASQTAEDTATPQKEDNSPSNVDKEGQ